MFFKKLLASVLTVLSLVAPSSVFAVTLIPSGESIGIELNYEGILITGSYSITVDNKKYDPLSHGLQIGDTIIAVNQQPVKTIQELSSQIKSLLQENQQLFITIKNNADEFEFPLKVEVNEKNEFTTGLYVQDKILSIGTMTYYNPSTNRYGALGHPINDLTRSNQSTLLQDGMIYNSEVTGLTKGQQNKAGQKVAIVDETIRGTVNNHTNIGIYGVYNSYDSTLEAMETAANDEVKLGEAYFLTVLQDNIVEKCKINITELKKQTSIAPKGIVFEITDQEVIKKTNGIIQGMSGSPIIQDDKIVGCVTHVSSNNPHLGYGLYIDWMLEIEEKENG